VRSQPAHEKALLPHELAAENPLPLEAEPAENDDISLSGFLVWHLGHVTSSLLALARIITSNS